MPLKCSWSDSEEEKGLKVPNKAEEEIEDWGGDIQKQMELKELEPKNSNITILQSSQKSPHPLQIQMKQ